MNADENEIELSNVVDDEKEVEKKSLVRAKIEAAADEASVLIASAADEASILREAVIDKTVTTITGSLAWMNAQLFVEAMTLSFNKSSDEASEVLLGLWFWWFGVFTLLLLVTYCCEGALSYEDKPAEAKTIAVNGQKEVVTVVERNFRQTKKAFALLFVESLVIVVAYAFRDAMMESIACITGSEVDPETGYYTNMSSDSGTLAAQVIYGFSATILGMKYISWLSSGAKHALDNEADNQAPKNQGRSVASRFQNEGTFKSSQILIATLIISYSITDFIGVMIIHVAGTSQSAEILGTLVYAFFLTIGVVKVLTVFDIYGMCIPMYSWQPFQVGSSERELSGAALVDAMNKAVGLAWMLFATACFSSMSSLDSRVVAEWIFAFIVTTITVIFSLYGYKWILTVQSNAGGFADFIKENVNSAFVPDREDENEEENPEKDFWYFYRAQAAETYLAASAVITGMAISSALSTTLRTYEDVYLRDTWILSIGSFVFSVLFTVYLGSLVQKVTEQRRALVRKVSGFGK